MSRLLTRLSEYKQVVKLRAYSNYTMVYIKVVGLVISSI